MTDSEGHTNFEAGPDPLIGQVVSERYRIERKLGQGGMGAVYQAEHVLIQKKVAIKCLHAGLASNADVVRRFHNEAVAATAIGHPNIVDVTDMGRFPDGTFFMVLEYLKGRDWQDDLDRTGAQSLSKVAHIGAQVCDALQAACEKGIVHRDLKPENIFLIERRGDPDFVKVLDFGISKFRSGIGGSTKTGELMGTPYYMAPEQVRGDKNITHLADIYATGVILFQALSGQVPFDGETLPELIMKIATEPAPSLAEAVPGIPPALDALIHSMLDKDPSARPQSFSEVGTHLSDFLPAHSQYRLSQTFGGRESFMETQMPGGMAHPPVASPVSSHLAQPSMIGGTPDNFAATNDKLAAAASPTPELDDDTPEAGESSAPGAAGAKANSKKPQLSTSTTAGQAVTHSGSSSSSSSKVGIFALAAAVLLGAAVYVFKPAPTSSEPAPVAAAPGNVRIKVSTTPRGATLRLNGQIVDNPYDWEYPESADELVFTTELEGYLPEKVKLSQKKSVYRPIILKRDPRAPEPKAVPVDEPAPSAKPSSNSQVAKRPKAKSSTAAPPSTKAPSSSAASSAAATPPPAAVPAPAPEPAPASKSQRDQIESPF